MLFALVSVCRSLSLSLGSLLENHREEWLPGTALGQIHHSEWRYACATALYLLLCYCVVFLVQTTNSGQLDGKTVHIVLFYSNISVFLSLVEFLWMFVSLYCLRNTHQD